MIKTNLRVIGLGLGIGGILASGSFAPMSYAKDKKQDSELKEAAEKAVKINREVDEGLNPVCAKCEAIAGNLPQVHKAISLFRDEKPIELEITADFDRLVKLKEVKGSTDAGVLQYLDANRTPHQLPVDVMTRGNSKADFFCKDFLPIRIAFKKDQDLSDTPFKGISEDFKIATHCRGKGKLEDSNVNVQRILREYTAYKALEALGFMSLKVRLAQIKYKNSKGEIYAEAKAFLLEPKSNMAKRYGKKQIKQKEASQAEGLSTLQLLPFDFSVRFLTQSDSTNDGNHNGIFVADKGSRKPDSIVPYDFDLITMIQDREYVGHQASFPSDDAQWLRQKIQTSQNRQEVKNVARYTLAHKDAVMKAIADSPAQDVSVMKQRAEAFFGAIDQVLKEQK